MKYSNSDFMLFKIILSWIYSRLWIPFDRGSLLVDVLIRFGAANHKGLQFSEDYWEQGEEVEKPIIVSSFL